MHGRSLRERLDAQMALNAAESEAKRRAQAEATALRSQVRELLQARKEDAAIIADLEAENDKYRRVMRKVMSHA